jgi:predicted ester cyclase
MANVDFSAMVREMFAAFDAKQPERIIPMNQPDSKVTIVPFGTSIGYKDYFQMWSTAFPDGKVEIVSVVAQGDRVWAEYIGRGTNTGPMQGPTGQMPPTNKKAEIRFAQVYEFRNGKVANSRVYFDVASMMAQLGISAPMPGKMPQAPQPQPRH